MAWLDRLTNAIRRRIDAALPWYEPAEADERRRETERIRRQSIAARLHVEDVAQRYQNADRRLRR